MTSSLYGKKHAPGQLAQGSAAGFRGFSRGRAKRHGARPYRAGGRTHARYHQTFDRAWVMHAFQKKSKSGISTPRQEIDLVRERLKRLKEMLK
jgi:hypothetical protein